MSTKLTVTLKFLFEVLSLQKRSQLKHKLNMHNYMI